MRPRHLCSCIGLRRSIPPFHDSTLNKEQTRILKISVLSIHHVAYILAFFFEFDFLFPFLQELNSTDFMSVDVEMVAAVVTLCSTQGPK